MIEKFELSLHSEKEDEFKLPSYSDKGNILVQVLSIDESPTATYKYEIDVLDYDSESSIFWITEGVGFDFWFDANCNDITIPGVYVVEGIHGQYFRRDWNWGEDDDEEWEYDSIRPATQEEIDTETLS